MHLLHATGLALAAVFTLAACSNDDSSTSPGQLPSSQQPAPTKFEAGAPCHTANDCLSGLTCLYPAPGCQNFQVCAPVLPSPCDMPQVACSCLAETVQVCDGYSVDPIDSLGPCAEGGVIVPIDAGSEASSASDAAADGPSDATLAADATDASDASDATTE